MGQDLDQLIARAEAATNEARRLFEKNLELRRKMRGRLDDLHHQPRFLPIDYPIHYPPQRDQDWGHFHDANRSAPAG